MKRSVGNDRKVCWALLSILDIILIYDLIDQLLDPELDIESSIFHLDNRILENMLDDQIGKVFSQKEESNIAVFTREIKKSISDILSSVSKIFHLQDNTEIFEV